MKQVVNKQYEVVLIQGSIEFDEGFPQRWKAMYFIIQFHFHLSFARIREFNLEVQHYVIQEWLRFRSFSFTPRLQPGCSFLDGIPEPFLTVLVQPNNRQLSALLIFSAEDFLKV